MVHKKTVGVEPEKDGKGIIFVTKKAKSQNKPSQTYHTVTLNRGARRSLNTIRKTMRKNRYRKDLRMAALRRASALLRSQKAENHK
ncbi:large ribosomal subunit protein eL28-like [Clavelina lepadiformis]|uniref:large ribosomal subunit protein eL28-like n=1 Tax=Clavelina lepadiformis TaxID=159417 RepID=UPI0040413423